MEVKERASEGDRQRWERRGGGGGTSAESEGAEQGTQEGGNVLTPLSPHHPAPYPPIRPPSSARSLSADLTPDVRGLPRLARQR